MWSIGRGLRATVQWSGPTASPQLHMPYRRRIGRPLPVCMDCSFVNSVCMWSQFKAPSALFKVMSYAMLLDCDAMRYLIFLSINLSYSCICYECLADGKRAMVS